MAELFIELFSEEIPAKLQIDARQKIKKAIEERLQKTEIQFNSSKSFSTPQRLVFVIDGIPEKVEEKKLRSGEEKKLEKKITKGLISPVKSLGKKAGGVLGTLMELFMTLLGGVVNKSRTRGNKSKCRR